MTTIHPLLRCLLLLVALSNLAHAFYDPGQGRWVSRDPIEEPSFSLTSKADPLAQELILKRRLIDQSRSTTTSRDNSRTLIKFLEGGDTTIAPEAGGSGEAYLFLNNSPLKSVDVIGLDRQIQGGVHAFFVLEEWIIVGGKYVSVGSTEWHFAPASGWLAPLSPFVPVKGKVSTFLGTLSQPSASTPCEDIQTKAKLSGYLTRPPYYHLLGFNCKDFANAMFLNSTSPPRKTCCNPDGTVWKR